MKKLIEKILKILAQRIIKKFNPKIIGITWSVGKTTMRECIAHVLNWKYTVLKSLKNYNTEIWVPLSILELEAGGNILNWGLVIIKAFKKAFFSKKYYEIIVLEMWADKPWDLNYLTSIIKPNISVITNVEFVHIENYKNREEIAKEKWILALNTKNNGIVYLNNDNEFTKKMNINKNCKLITFWRNADISFQFQNKIIQIWDEIFNTKDIDGEYLMYSLSVATSIGLELGMNKNEIEEKLQSFKSPEKRMEILELENWINVIDSSYNAEPASMKAAIDVLNNMKTNGKKIAFLGDMLELWKYEKTLHEEISQYIENLNIKIIFVGEKMKYAHNLNSQSLYFKTSEEASENLPKINSGDIVLVKWSNSMKMNKIINKIK